MKYIDAELLKVAMVFNPKLGDLTVPEMRDILTEIDSAPAADVEPVVRCKDCKHRDPEDLKCDCGRLERAGCIFSVSDNYFCAHGERKGKM